MDQEKLREILLAFSTPDNEIIKSATNVFLQALESDPNTIISELFIYIKENSASTQRTQAFIQAKNFLYKINVEGKEDTLEGDTYQNIMLTLVQLLEEHKINDIESKYVFLIISSFIKTFILPGHWNQIFDVMWELADTKLSSHVIKFFSDYISYFKIDTITQLPEDFITKIVELLKFDSSDPEVIISSISLSFRLMSVISDFIPLLENIPQVISKLPDDKINASISLFDGFYQFNSHYINDYKESFVSLFLQIAQNTEREDFCRIAPLEIIRKMLTRDSFVRHYLNDNLNDLLQTLAICFQLNDREDPIYNAAAILLEEFVDDSESKNKVISTISDESLPDTILSVFYLYISNVQNIDKVIQFVQNQDSNVSKNAFETIDKYLHDQYKKLVRFKPGIIQELIDLLFAYVESVQGDDLPGIATLAQLAETLSTYNKEKLQSISPQLLQVQEKVFNSDSVRCIAAVAEAFPEEISQESLNLAVKSMELINNTNDEETTYALMIAVSKFAKCMPKDSFQEFVLQLMNMVKQVPETSAYQGLRIIAQQIKEPFAQFLPLFINYLFDTAMQPFEHFVSSEDKWDVDSFYGYSEYLLPGGSKMGIRNEQMYEISNALDSIADYATAVGNSFNEYFEQAFAAAVRGISTPYDTAVRVSGVNLFKVLTTINPSSIEEIYNILMRKIIGSSDQKEKADDETEIEPELEPKVAIINVIEKILRNEQCPPPARIQFLSAIPEIYTSTLALIRSDIDSEDFEEEYDNYLDFIWTISTILRFLYDKIPDEAGETFTKLHEVLVPFQEDGIPLLRQFSLAVWCDFLSYGPEKFVSQCDEMIPQVMEMINSSDAYIRRIALNSVGHIFEKKSVPASELDKILGILFVAATNEDAQNDENLFEGNDSAVSSFAILLKKRIPMGNASECIGQFIQMFPAEDDLEEAEIAYGYLFQLLWDADKNAEIAKFGQPICDALAQGLEIEVLNEKIKALIENKLKDSNGNIPSQVSQFLSLEQ